MILDFEKFSHKKIHHHITKHLNHEEYQQVIEKEVYKNQMPMKVLWLMSIVQMRTKIFYDRFRFHIFELK